MGKTIHILCARQKTKKKKIMLNFPSSLQHGQAWKTTRFNFIQVLYSLKQLYDKVTYKYLCMLSLEDNS